MKVNEHEIKILDADYMVLFCEVEELLGLAGIIMQNRSGFVSEDIWMFVENVTTQLLEVFISLRSSFSSEPKSLFGLMSCARSMTEVDKILENLNLKENANIEVKIREYDKQQDLIRKFNQYTRVCFLWMRQKHRIIYEEEAQAQAARLELVRDYWEWIDGKSKLGTQADLLKNSNIPPLRISFNFDPSPKNSLSITSGIRNMQGGETLEALYDMSSGFMHFRPDAALSNKSPEVRNLIVFAITLLSVDTFVGCLKYLLRYFRLIFHERIEKVEEKIRKLDAHRNKIFFSETT